MPITAPALLIAAGEALFGAEWQAPLAGHLPNRHGDSTNPRTVRRWITGQNPIPPAVFERLAQLLADHAKECQALAAACAAEAHSEEAGEA